MAKRLIDFTDEELESLIEKSFKKCLAQNEKPTALKPHMNVVECSEYTGMAIPTLYQKSSKREIPASKVGGRLMFDRREIDAWIASKKRLMVEDL